MTLSEKDCVYVSSRGLLKSCNIHSNNPISDYRGLDWNALKSAISTCNQVCPTVYICTAALPVFIQHLDDLPKRIILVSGDSDLACTDIDYAKIIECRKIAHWFAQNCNLPVNLSHRVTPMPIGLDYHTLANTKGEHAWGYPESPVDQEALLLAIEKTPLKERKLACYANFQFFTKSRYGPVREDAVLKLNERPHLVYYEPEKVERAITWANQLDYAFVISPPGNGLDCHRTWEALVLGCIPVVVRTGTLLDELYESLSALLVDNYSITETDLEKASCSGSSTSLTLKYWTNLWAGMQRQEERNMQIIGELPLSPAEAYIPECTVGLCVYNNEFGLPYVLRNLMELQRNKVFRINIIAYLNKCSDMSVMSLSYVPMRIINGGPADLTQERTARIALARNGILEEIARTKRVPYFAMMDSNEYACVGAIDVNVVKRVMTDESQWDAISFNREAGYYDTWALSYEPYIYSFFHFNNWRQVVEKMRADINEKLKWHQAKEHQAKEHLVPVYSAFNGFSIYKTDKFINCRYSNQIDRTLFPPGSLSKEESLVGQSILPSLNNDCEHRAFHLQAVTRGARIFVCPEALFKKFQGELPSYCRGPA